VFCGNSLFYFSFLVKVPCPGCLTLELTAAVFSTPIFFSLTYDTSYSHTPLPPYMSQSQISLLFFFAYSTSFPIFGLSQFWKTRIPFLHFSPTFKPNHSTCPLCVTFFGFLPDLPSFRPSPEFPLFLPPHFCTNVAVSLFFFFASMVKNFRSIMKSSSAYSLGC